MCIADFIEAEQYISVVDIANRLTTIEDRTQGLASIHHVQFLYAHGTVGDFNRRANCCYSIVKEKELLRIIPQCASDSLINLILGTKRLAHIFSKKRPVLDAGYFYTLLQWNGCDNSSGRANLHLHILSLITDTIIIHYIHYGDPLDNKTEDGRKKQIPKPIFRRMTYDRNTITPERLERRVTDDEDSWIPATREWNETDARLKPELQDLYGEKYKNDFSDANWNPEKENRQRRYMENKPENDDNTDGVVGSNTVIADSVGNDAKDDQ